MKYLLIALAVFCAVMMVVLTREEAAYRIAILTPMTHPSLEQIEKGFVKTLAQHDCEKFKFKTYNALGNKTLMRSCVEEIARGKYDLVLAIGASTARMSKEVFEKKLLSTPIVFTAVPTPLKFDLIASEASSGNQLTGVKETTDFAKELGFLRDKVKSVLLVYDPSQHSLEMDKQEIKKVLDGMGIEMGVAEVFKTNEILMKSTTYIDDVDAVLVIKDNTVVSGIDALVKLCEQKEKLLIASDLDSADRGVPLAFGVSELIYGEEAAKKALSILVEKKMPREIPITAPPSEAFVFKINQKRLQALGISYD
jgi:putative ABC transport system substrate-binding protein